MRDWWEYRYANIGPRIVYVQFSDDSVVRELLDLADEERRYFGIRQD